MPSALGQEATLQGWLLTLKSKYATPTASGPHRYGTRVEGYGVQDFGIQAST